MSVVYNTICTLKERTFRAFKGDTSVSQSGYSVIATEFQDSKIKIRMIVQEITIANNNRQIDKLF